MLPLPRDITIALVGLIVSALVSATFYLDVVGDKSDFQVSLFEKIPEKEIGLFLVWQKDHCIGHFRFVNIEAKVRGFGVIGQLNIGISGLKSIANFSFEAYVNPLDQVISSNASIEFQEGLVKVASAGVDEVGVDFYLKPAQGSELKKKLEFRGPVIIRRDEEGGLMLSLPFRPSKAAFTQKFSERFGLRVTRNELAENDANPALVNGCEGQAQGFFELPYSPFEHLLH